MKYKILISALPTAFVYNNVEGYEILTNNGVKIISFIDARTGETITAQFDKCIISRVA